MFSKDYSLYKSYQILSSANKIYQQKRSILSNGTRHELEDTLSSLQEAILDKDRKTASAQAKRTEELIAPYAQRPWWRWLGELVATIAIALLAATLIRQVWFEIYKIPTGSMRPTFREEDCLTVTKTAFGINTPLDTSHLYFDPALVLRTGAFTFTSDGLDMKDTDTRYFWLFPAKKQLVKRCMGLAGDTLYFYGGKLYGFDQDGYDITPLLNPEWMERLDHVPFMQFLGRTSLEVEEETKTHQLLVRQMNIPIGKLLLSPQNIQGLIRAKEGWVPDDPYAAIKPHSQPVTYSEFFGMDNFAMARLLSSAEAERFFGREAAQSAKAPYYLELFHHPSLQYPLPRMEKGPHNSLQLALPGFSSLLPLDEAHVALLRQGLYTSRFVVKHGKAAMYAEEGSPVEPWSPSMQGVPEGTYEFYYGKAYSVGFGGHLTELDAEHPLSVFATKHIQELFNLGIELHTSIARGKEPFHLPPRFAYFRDGAFYVMGTPIMQPGDARLEAFIAKENERQSKATASAPYLAFIDKGAPYKDGVLDVELIRSFGVKIPPKHYMALGDNYARSSDSRYFGFVPEENLKGAPSWIFFPFGPRWGAPLQADYPFMNIPRFIIWTIALLCLLAWWLYTRWQMSRRVYQKP